MLVLPCGYSVGFSWLLSRILFVCLFLAFSSLMCLDVDFIEFILLGIYWNSWIFTFISFTKLGSFQPIFLLILFQHHSLFPPGTLTTWMSDTLLFTYLPLRFSLFPSWFFSLCCLAWWISFDLHHLHSASYPIQWFRPLFWRLNFSVLRFPHGSSLCLFLS